MSVSSPKLNPIPAAFVTKKTNEILEGPIASVMPRFPSF